MATFRVDALPAARPVKPLAIADEQVRILRIVARHEPRQASLELEDGLLLEHWEQALLYREAHSNRDIKGEALTLLRARAAEWAVRRRLRLAGGLDSSAAAATVALLDRTLADIGSMTEFPGCRHLDGLEQVARRLHRLYEQVAELSLRLAGLEGRPVVDESWRVDAMADDAFELVEGSRRAPEEALAPVLDGTDGDHFGLEVETAIAAEPQGAVALVTANAATAELFAFDLCDTDALGADPTTAAAPALPSTPVRRHESPPRAALRSDAAASPPAARPAARRSPASAPAPAVAPEPGPRRSPVALRILGGLVVAAIVGLIAFVAR